MKTNQKTINENDKNKYNKWKYIVGCKEKKKNELNADFSRAAWLA